MPIQKHHVAVPIETRMLVAGRTDRRPIAQRLQGEIDNVLYRQVPEDDPHLGYFDEFVGWPGDDLLHVDRNDRRLADTLVLGADRLEHFPASENKLLLLLNQNVIPCPQRPEHVTPYDALGEQTDLLARRDLDGLVEPPAVIVLVENADHGTQLQQ
jgi:hypothetical protein